MDAILTLVTIPDVMIIGGVFFFFFVYAWQHGSGQPTLFLLSLLPAALLLSLMPYKSTVAKFFPQTDAGAVLALLTVLIISTGLFMWLISRILPYIESEHGIIHASMLALSIVVVLLVIAYHIVPVGELYDFGSRIDFLFASKEKAFWITIAVLAAAGFSQEI